jgi:hypothetical protein
MLERRKSRRTKMVLPVKVSIGKASHLVHTVDITDKGAQLGGLRMQLQTGMTISLQRGSHKAKFRIAWIRQLAPNEIRAGIESLEPQNNVWGVDLYDEQREPNKNVEALMTLLSDFSPTVTS